MRLLQLELERFRHFRDQSLVLATAQGQGRGLSVIYGPNEAGKTTVLSAIRCFLFGFKEKSPELTLDFDQSELRVGARMELDNGRKLLATRTKGRKQTLFGRSEEGGEEFDEEWFHARLSRPSKAVFENVFGFSLDMLARGAESLKEHEVKSAIYGAGFGGNVDLEKLVGDLRKERDSLFKEGGKNPRINQLARQLDERRKAIRQATTPGEEHRRVTEQLREQKQAAQQLYGAESGVRAELDRTRAVLSAIEPHRAWLAAEAELAALELPQGFGVEAGHAYENGLTVRDQIREEQRSLEERMRETRERLAEWRSDPEILVAADAIDALAHDLGAYQKGLAERPKNAEARESLSRRTRERLRGMHPSWDLPELRAMRLDAVSRGEFFDAAAEQERLRGERERVAQRGRELDALMRQRDLQRRKLDAPFLRAELDPLAMVVPPRAELARYEALFAVSERELAGQRARRTELQATLRVHQQELAAIEAAGHAPQERDLESARQRRQAGWRILERALSTGTPPSVEEEKRYGEGEPLMRAYERAVTVADDIADRMRVHADAVQKRALHASLVARYEEQIGELEREIARAEEAAQEAERAWLALWARSEVAPLGPAAMQSWLEAREMYVDLDAKVSESRAARDRDEAQLAADEAVWRTRFEALVARVGYSSDIGTTQVLRLVDDLAELRRTFEAEEQHLADAAARLGREIDAYEERVRALGARFSESGPLEPARAVERWRARLLAAREAARMREELDRSRTADEHRMVHVTARLEEAESKIREVRALAGERDDEGVRRVAAMARRERELSRVVDEQQRAVRRAGARWEWEPFVDDVGKADPELLNHRIATLEAEAAALREQASVIEREVGKLTETLARLDGGSRAADEQAAAEALRASLSDDIERYAVLTFAEEILHGSIRRFEREHQPELLLRAGEAFARMTHGRYPRIERRLDGTLLAYRDDGRTLLPDALSTGTREQLFIALRLAYVESYAKSAESLPMVLDDVLVNFDEERTRGALSALSNFAERTQVLLFTCHANLVALVRDVIPHAHHAEIPR